MRVGLRLSMADLFCRIPGLRSCSGHLGRSSVPLASRMLSPSPPRPCFRPDDSSPINDVTLLKRSTHRRTWKSFSQTEVPSYGCCTDLRRFVELDCSFFAAAKIQTE